MIENGTFDIHCTSRPITVPITPGANPVPVTATRGRVSRLVTYQVTHPHYQRVPPTEAARPKLMT